MVQPRKTPFVGRAVELQQMMRLLSSAGGGEGQLAVIQGPAGIGKTRLAEEVMARARARGLRVAIGRGWPDGEAPPFWPWRAILADLGAGEGLLDEKQAELPHERFARFLAVLDHLRAVHAPLVIVVDDAHLADPASLLLVRFLIREGRLPLLLLLTRRDGTPGRDAEILELLSDLERDAAAIQLSGLSRDAVRAYLTVCGAGRPDPRLLDAVAAVTQGNPLHLRSVTMQSELGAGGIRGGLEHAIDRVFERLSGADRRLIALAAVLGPEVSVHEVARVADAPPADAAESLARAARVGLMAERGNGRYGFVHDVVRQAATSSLALSERLDAHARAAALLTGHDPERVSLRAHHALAAASRSREDAAAAVTIGREAARALRAVDGFESAAAMLGRAAEIHAAAGLTGPAAELVVERAESVLACGRLAEARVLFRQSARTAETEGDPVALAHAAIGLGGLWVGEHRLPGEAERVRMLQRRALEALPPEETVLGIQLKVRLAAEEAYRGGSVTPVLEGVEAARRTGDRRALAEALSLCHHALLTPEHTWRRLDLANELIATAAAAGDGLLSLVGLCWRAADLFLLGDAGAGPALEKLRHRADALGCRSILFIVRAMEVMLAIRGGGFAQAEEAAAACFALGNEVGDADALAYHGAHLCAIRFFQGREAELAGVAASIAASPTLIEERERAFAAASALFSLRAGKPEPAQAMLERLAREGLASLPPSSSWLLTLLAVAEIALALGDARVAREAYDALLPYAELPVMASLAVVCFGSARRALGVAALASGNADLAIEHLTAAVAASERLGHRPAAAQARAELALLHLRRAGRSDRQRGRELLQQSVAAGDAMGMSGLVTRWREAEAAAGSGGGPSELQGARMALAQAGRWRVIHEDQIATVPDRVGMRYLARLLAAPDRDIAALALVADDAGATPAGRGDAVMDRRAVAALRERIRRLRDQAELSPNEQDELAALTRELARATGLGRRIRSFPDVPERARTAVRKAIKRAIDEISAANPAVGRHLALKIETGAVCCYRLKGAGSADVLPFAPSRAKAEPPRRA